MGGGVDGWWWWGGGAGVARRGVGMGVGGERRVSRVSNCLGDEILSTSSCRSKKH